MRIKYLGHSSFLITSETGTKIITDPFDVSFVSGDGPCYGPITEPADIATVSHEHHDHNNVEAIPGNPTIVRDSSKIKGIEFKTIPSHHDEAGGSKRGKNTIFCFYVDGVRICHLGDLGHQLNDKQVSEMGKVDVLLLPVGGYYTIDARVATQVGNQIKPRVIIPIHFKTEKCAFPIAAVDDFLKGKQRIDRPDTSEVDFRAGELPTNTRIIVLKPAL